MSTLSSSSASMAAAVVWSATTTIATSTAAAAAAADSVSSRPYWSGPAAAAAAAEAARGGHGRLLLNDRRPYYEQEEEDVGRLRLAPQESRRIPVVDDDGDGWWWTTLRGGTLSGGSNDDNSSSSKKESKETSSKRSRKCRTGSSSKKNKSGSRSSSKESPKAKTSPIVEEILKTEDYYEILGITKDRITKSKHPERDIQKAYRKRAVQTHPDKTNGDRRAFDKVAEAYEILQDKDKRNMYNRFGKEHVQQHQQYGGGGAGGPSQQQQSAEDLFRRFFGGSHASSPFGNSHFQRYQQRYQLPVTLEDMYLGRSTTVQLPNGQSINVNIPRGSYDSQDIQVEEEETTDSTSNNVHFILQQRPHPTFIRKGHDLAVKITISLSEALTGLQRKIRHLDGQYIHILSASAKSSGSTKNNDDSDTEVAPALIQTGDVHVYKGRGMPKDASGHSFGDLYIQYQVKMPTRSSSSSPSGLTQEERRQLQTLLSKLEGRSTPKSSEWPFGKKNADVLQTASLSDFGRGQQQQQRHQQPPRYEQQNSFQSSGFSPFGQQRFYWSGDGSNPFFGDGTPMGDDDADAGAEQQCRQM